MVHISGYEEAAFAIFGFRIPYEELQKKWIEQEVTTMLKIGESLSSNGSRALPDGSGGGFTGLRGVTWGVLYQPM